MKISAWIVLMYALIILVGGMIGFKQAHSYPSLIAGLTASCLLFICGGAMLRGSNLAFSLAMAITLALTLFFAYRYTLTHKFMPAGIMSLVSALTLVIVLAQRKKKAKFI